MRAEQAIFTSIRSSTRQGYHLAARSPGVGGHLGQQLYQWGPSHGSLLDDKITASSLNSFQLSSDWIVVSRTVYGAPEYSGRGALQVVTLILAVRRSQLSAFDDNPVSLARTALTLGYLRLPASVPETLPQITLPDRALLAASAATRHSLDDSILDRSLRLLGQGQRIALVGADDPVGTMAHLIRRIPAKIRAETSFTTGLRPSRQRPFRVHIVPRIDADIQRRLAAQGIHALG